MQLSPSVLKSSITVVATKVPTRNYRIIIVVIHLIFSFGGRENKLLVPGITSKIL